MSNVESHSSLTMTSMRAMKVPVRPTPAEQCTSSGACGMHCELGAVLLPSACRTSLISEKSSLGESGTLRSAQPVNWICVTRRFWPSLVALKVRVIFKSCISLATRTTVMPAYVTESPTASGK